MSAACAAMNGVVGPRNVVRPAAGRNSAAAAREVVIESPPAVPFGKNDNGS